MNTPYGVAAVTVKLTLTNQDGAVLVDATEEGGNSPCNKETNFRPPRDSRGILSAEIL